LKGAGDIGERLAELVAAANRFALLVQGQLRLAAELDAARFCAFSTFTGTDPDQLALELRLMRSFA
jgi:hypothetical protein